MNIIISLLTMEKIVSNKVKSYIIPKGNKNEGKVRKNSLNAGKI